MFYSNKRCSISFLFKKLFAYLRPFYYFCTMQQDYDSSASGYLEDSYEGISRTFTDVEILSTSEVNVVAKAKRYGRWWLLKGLQQDAAGKAASRNASLYVARAESQGRSRRSQRHLQPRHHHGANGSGSFIPPYNK